MKGAQSRIDDADPNDALRASAVRRRLLLAGVAAAAVAGGAAVAWRLSSLRESDGSGAIERFWQLEFETPEGGKIKTVGLRGKPLLVNFWATWCPPCIEELPLIDKFYREHATQRGIQVLGIAIDQPAAVRKFLERLPLAFPTAIAGLQGTTLARALGNEAGGLPFSLMIGRKGSIEQRRLGTLTLQDLHLWLADAG